MKALYLDALYAVVDDTGSGVVLEPVDGTEDQRVDVPYTSLDLLVDPTDEDLARARARVEDRREHYREAAFAR